VRFPFKKKEKRERLAFMQRRNKFGRPTTKRKEKKPYHGPPNQ
jgi:hypothetical protein